MRREREKYGRDGGGICGEERREVGYVSGSDDDGDGDAAEAEMVS